MAGGAERSAAIWRAGAAQGEAAAGKQACPQEGAPVLRPRLGAALGWAQHGGGRAGAGGPQTGRPALRRARGWGGDAARGSGALGIGEGVSRAVARRPRTPAGFPGCAEREPQRSAPPPGSCDLAALGTTPSTRLAISGRGAGLGSRQGAGERWPKGGAPRRLWAGAPGAHRLPPAMLADATVRWRLFLPAPPRPGAPSAGRDGRGVAPGRPGSLPTLLAAGPGRRISAFLRRAEPSRGA